MGSSKTLLAALANHSKRFCALVASIIRDCEKGAPMFCVSRVAKSIAFSLKIFRMSSMIRDLSAGSMLRHTPLSNDSLAARIALSVSSSVPRGTLAKASPLLGLITSAFFPSDASHHSPPIYIW